ncbi:uncharacterized protein LOC126899872 [Daktulosphaira vitifoliae]|uniref:uncharacterized protein LOC126899872 n=1 Tax=Daktulosphaira vitifoliae TaxID=58002 RepID=UPI0021AA8D1B|nr:uncharacterized protein LOC126899872 [Daktulosphaira vitifoliae]
MVNAWFVLLTVAAIVSIAVEAGQHDHYFILGAHKDPRCHGPKITNCNSSIYPIMDYKEAAWFYHIPFKSCRPLYTAGGVHVCSANMDLPISKEECERICGETCKLDDGSEGICSFDEFCKNAGNKSGNTRPCRAYNVKCCPKNPNSTNSNTISRRQNLVNNNPQNNLDIQNDESMSFEEEEMLSESIVDTVGEKVVNNVMNWLPSEIELEGVIHRIKRHHCKHHPEKCAYHRQKIIDKLLRKINYFGQKYGGYDYGNAYNDELVTGYQNHHHQENHKQGMQGYYNPPLPVTVVQKQLPIEYQREFSKETYNEDPKDYRIYPVPLVPLPHKVEYPIQHQNNYRKEFQIGFRKEY